MTVESVRPAAPRRLGSCPIRPSRAAVSRSSATAGRLVRDPLGYFARLRDHGDVVRLKLGPKTVYAATTPGTDRGAGAQPRLHHRRPAVGVPRRAARQGGCGHRQRAHPPAPAAHHPARVPARRPSPSTGRSWRRRRTRSPERWQPGETIDCTAEAFRIAVRIAARCLLRGDYMDERAERLCAALATVFLGYVPADGDPGGTALPAAAAGQPQIQPGPGRFASRSSTRSWPSAGHPVKSRTIC